MKLAIISGVILFLSLAGCAPAPQRLTPLDSEKIGVAFLIDKHPKFVYIGTTIFNIREYPRDDIDWEIEAHALATIKHDLLAKPGYTVKVIAPSDLLTNDRLDLVESSGFNGYRLKRDVEAEFVRLAREDKLDALIVIRPYRGQVQENVSVDADGYGLYTHCFLMFCNALPLANETVDVFDMHPPRLAGWDRVESIYNWTNTKISVNFKFDSGWGNLPESEINRVKDAVLKHLDDQIHSALLVSGLK